MKVAAWLILFCIVPLHLPLLAASEVQPSRMITIAPGGFTMGSSDEDIMWAAQQFFSESLDYYRDETPAHTVNLPAYKIDITEVTVGQYQAYMMHTGAPVTKFMKIDRFNEYDQPVVGVTWQEATDYCATMNKRLPTEAEWEKAARGTDARFYPWGNEPDLTRANVRGKKDGFRYTAPVGQDAFGKSPYGVQDMAGNVWEWTADWYQPHPGNTVPNDFYGKQFKVIKGGSWFSNMDLARISVRGKNLPDKRHNYIGFRCAQ